MIKIQETEIGSENNTGRLQVSVFDQSKATPVNQARVTVMDNQNNVINVLYTDISGQTDIIELYAPPIDYSLEPNMPKPFSQYNITITADGFETLLIYGTQVFADILAIQQAYLIPINYEETERQITILVPTLWGDYPEKIAEDEEKPLPPQSGFVVLDNVVIPEYIVVHDGNPNDNTAPNYYIPYKDYIKNVASSEIYSTWSDAAIRANILAINSFTLNRVYTEWYRSRGKNFTITSSTAYDQFFVYGRNIFDDINAIVDEMFTTYIKRFNSEQPLFAQYCDGIRVSCPNWLSQWGSQSLAEQGFNAVEILRYYYGSDIYLENAEKVSGVPSSFPGEILQVGSTGQDVRTIQQQLNTISNNYPAIIKIAVDGVYGERTAEAVIQFQQIFNLPPTGSVDFATWYQISQIYVAVARLAEL